MRQRKDVLITPYRDGPLIVRGDFQLIPSGGRELDGRWELDGRGEAGDRGELDDRRRPVALCRCGRSRCKPFCDGTHKQTGFTADGV